MQLESYFKGSAVLTSLRKQVLKEATVSSFDMGSVVPQHLKGDVPLIMLCSYIAQQRHLDHKNV